VHTEDFEVTLEQYLVQDEGLVEEQKNEPKLIKQMGRTWTYNHSVFVLLHGYRLHFQIIDLTLYNLMGLVLLIIYSQYHYMLVIMSGYVYNFRCVYNMIL